MLRRQLAPTCEIWTALSVGHEPLASRGGDRMVFDNGDGPYATESQSRALRIRLNYKRRLATLAGAYTHRPPLLSQSEGAMQVLSDGNTFVGWGAKPYFTEFGPGGKQLFDAHFGTPLQSESQLGTFQSHGCVRQRPEDAIFMWDWSQIGDTVVVTA